MKDYLVVIGQMLLILAVISLLGFIFVGLPLYFGGPYAGIFYGIVLGGLFVGLLVSGVREAVRDRRWERSWSERDDKRHTQ